MPRTITLFNTLGREKQVLTTLVPDQVGIYLCGITVYDLCHLGHARVMCAMDSIVRYLEFVGYKVKLVRNITDVDDKIIHRAVQEGTTATQVAARNIADMHADFAALGLRVPDCEPRATEYIQPIIDLIQTLIDRGYAYPTGSGDVYYRVRKFAGYGKLSGKKIDELLTGVRIDPDQDKEYPLDFALWKHADAEEVHWQSPWGAGRPGWHIECSAMSMHELGGNFDIHAGGPDLIFPHHENEIAQSCAAQDCEYARYWLHAGPLRMGDDKMSKSLGNFITIRDALDRHSAEVWRVWFAMSHYRSPIHYQPELILQAAQVTKRLYLRLREVKPDCQPLHDLPQIDAFHQAMADDCNTREALVALQSMAASMHQADLPRRQAIGATLLQLARSIGLLQSDPQQWLQRIGQMTQQTIEELIAARNAARTARDFVRADAIRDQLAAQGIVLEDKADTTLWRCE